MQLSGLKNIILLQQTEMQAIWRIATRKRWRFRGSPFPSIVYGSLYQVKNWCWSKSNGRHVATNSSWYVFTKLLFLLYWPRLKIFLTNGSTIFRNLKTYFDNCFQREKKSCAAMSEGLKNLLIKIGNFNVILWFIPFTLQNKEQ